MLLICLDPRFTISILIVCLKRVFLKGRLRTSYLTYVHKLLGDNEGALQEQQIASLADDRRTWRNLVVACSAADGG